MARLTYGSVVAALVALVAGFFVRTSNVPLLVSIGFSALSTVLILGGWGRRLRKEREGEVAPSPEIDFIDVGTSDEPDTGVRARLATRRAERALRAHTDELPVVEEEEEEEERVRKPRKPRAKPRAKRRARPEPAAPVSYVDLEADLEDLPDPADIVAPSRPKVAPKAKAKPKPKTKAKPKPKPKSPSGGTANEVIIVPGRGRYHRPGCRFADVPIAKPMPVATARRRGYVACSVCTPD